MICFRPAFIAALLAAPMVYGQTVANLDFETAGQFSNNFRSTFNSSTASQTSEVSGNDYLQIVGSTGTTPWIGLYDTTPLDNSDPTQSFSGTFTLHLDIIAAPHRANGVNDSGTSDITASAPADGLLGREF